MNIYLFIQQILINSLTYGNTFLSNVTVQIKFKIVAERKKFVSCNLHVIFL